MAGFDLKDGIRQSAEALGIDPVDLGTVISYETAGTFDPTKRGPTTKWGQHRGLIQFGEPQAKKYGVNWDDPLGSQLGPEGAVVKYLRDAGVKPGMSRLDIYSAINAGGVGRNNRSDAAAGGAPGTVADKVRNQMAGHEAKAVKLFGGTWTPSAPSGDGESQVARSGGGGRIAGGTTMNDSSQMFDGGDNPQRMAIRGMIAQLTEELKSELGAELGMGGEDGAAPAPRNMLESLMGGAIG